MTEHPIIFSGAMVRSILSGTKTQTRRVVKGLIKQDESPCNIRLYDGEWQQYGAGGVWLTLRCPYGVPGDKLWVRETWRECGSAQMADGKPIPGLSRYEVAYRADESWDEESRWRPSIHMPRWASRITLEVTEVRVQRVQSISNSDARAEGCSNSFYDGYDFSFLAYEATPAIANFRRLWDSINAKRGFGWLENPWVFAVSFKRLEKP
jgi:hypothetical protein